jgi:hypothetical protein
MYASTQARRPSSARLNLAFHRKAAYDLTMVSAALKFVPLALLACVGDAPQPSPVRPAQDAAALDSAVVIPDAAPIPTDAMPDVNASTCMPVFAPTLNDLSGWITQGLQTCEVSGSLKCSLTNISTPNYNTVQHRRESSLGAKQFYRFIYDVSFSVMPVSGGVIVSQTNLTGQPNLQVRASYDPGTQNVSFRAGFESDAAGVPLGEVASTATSKITIEFSLIEARVSLNGDYKRLTAAAASSSGQTSFQLGPYLNLVPSMPIVTLSYRNVRAELCTGSF